MKRVCLWCSPRNISTAMMYSFAQRSDTTVVDEPLYGFYLSHTDADEYHPGAEEVIADQENNGRKVIDEIVLGEYKTPVVVFKQMTHHLLDLDRSFLKETINIFLTREPEDMLRSFVNQIEKPTLRDTGYKLQSDLLEYLHSIGQQPLVMDSKEILMDPESRLTEMCDYIGVPFKKSMLHWEAGPRPEDGIWAKYWYHNVHRSTGFQKYKPKQDPVPEHLKALLEECELYYKKIMARR